MIFNRIIQLLFIIVLILALLVTSEKYIKSDVTELKENLKWRTSYISPTLKPYVDSFICEANQRGLKINTDSLNIRIQSKIFHGLYAGLTLSEQHTILIDTATSIWRNNPETLMYHELAHLLLKRHHDNSFYVIKMKMHPNAYFPKSLMHTSHSYFYDISDTLIRNYYIDELFDSCVTLPNWIEENK